MHDPLFHDRQSAGIQLAAALERYRPTDPLILALPRGGVPVAFEVACALEADLDLLIVRKIGAPGYEEFGIGAVVGAVIVTAAFSPLVFFGNVWWWALTGLFLWGVGYAVQDTLLKVLIASVLPEGRRNYAFGRFYIGYGAGWLAGSIAAGLLYERSLIALVSFAVIAQLASVPLVVMGSRTSE